MGACVCAREGNRFLHSLILYGQVCTGFLGLLVTKSVCVCVCVCVCVRVPLCVYFCSNGAWAGSLFHCFDMPYFALCLHWVCSGLALVRPQQRVRVH